MLTLLLALACARSTAPESAVTASATTEVVVPVTVETTVEIPDPDGNTTLTLGAAPAPTVGAYYDPVPAALADCSIDADNQVGWLVQLTCPGNRVLTDMRGAGVPAPDQVLEAIMQALGELGLQALPRQATTALPGTTAQAQVVDGQGPDLATTTWVVHHMGTMPQALTCMALQSDAEAEAWCLGTMAEMLLPPGPTLGAGVLGDPL